MSGGLMAGSVLVLLATLRSLWVIHTGNGRFA